jgi:hypothetical protein
MSLGTDAQEVSVRATSEWNEAGMRVAAEDTNGMIVMTCETQAVTASPAG